MKLLFLHPHQPSQFRLPAIARGRRKMLIGHTEDGRELSFIARHARIDFVWHERPPGVLLGGVPGVPAADVRSAGIPQPGNRQTRCRAITRS